MNKMNKFFFLFAYLLLIVGIASCNTDKQPTRIDSEGQSIKEMEIDNFICLEASSSIDVYYTQSPDRSYVSIHAPKNVVDYVIAKVHNGILSVYVDERANGVELKPTDRVDVHVVAPEVTGFYAKSSGDIILTSGLSSDTSIELEAANSGDIKISKILKCTNLKLRCLSSGDISIAHAQCNNLNIESQSSGDIRIKEVNAREVVASTTSSGDISMYGWCINAELKAESSGDIFAREMVAKTVKAEAISNGEIRCYATESATLTSNAHGNIIIYGNPKHLDTTNATKFRIKH